VCTSPKFLAGENNFAFNRVSCRWISNPTTTSFLIFGNENFDDDDDGEEEEEKDDDVKDDDRVLLVVVVLIKVFVKAPRWWWVHSDAPNVAFDTANKAALLLIPFSSSILYYWGFEKSLFF
tara:strand:+ start:11088 stop:11450 length:363 start_codon:yes stop_codon:yes gene_type:complete